MYSCHGTNFACGEYLSAESCTMNHHTVWREIFKGVNFRGSVEREHFAEKSFMEINVKGACSMPNALWRKPSRVAVKSQNL